MSPRNPPGSQLNGNPRPQAFREPEQSTNPKGHDASPIYRMCVLMLLLPISESTSRHRLHDFSEDVLATLSESAAHLCGGLPS